MKAVLKVDLTVESIDEWKVALFISVVEAPHMPLLCRIEADSHTQLPACATPELSLILSESRCSARWLLSRSLAQMQAGTPLRKSFFALRCVLISALCVSGSRDRGSPMVHIQYVDDAIGYNVSGKQAGLEVDDKAHSASVA